MLPNQCNALQSFTVFDIECRGSCIDVCSEWAPVSPKFRMQFSRACFNF